MSLEQAIHQRWTDSAALSALLPPARLTTGRSGGGERPYATIQSLRRSQTLPTNAGNTVEEASMDLCVWHDDFDVGEQIVEYIQTVFDRAVFNLPDDSAVVRMRETSMSATHKKDGVWCWKIKFLANICAVLDS